MKDYFDGLMVNRQRLLWAIATRRQLERWEPIVAASVREDFGDRTFPDVDIWLGEIERHFVLVAARNLMRALELDPASTVAIEETMRDELIEGRDLVEHWPDNLPVFNVRPRSGPPPRRSGQEFAKRNPERSPYNWLQWESRQEAMLLPNVSAPQLHQLVDVVEAEVLASDETLSRFVPPREPSPWIHEDGEWWPRPAQ
jgi:hypothetical protein